MVEGHGKFRRHDLVITREMHEANEANGVYPVLTVVDADLTIKREDQPTFEDLQYILERVGGPYGWDRRREYHEQPSIDEISEILAKPSSRRYSFWATTQKGTEEVGGVIIANVESELRLRKMYKFARESSDSYSDLTADSAAKTTEIYKIGLFPEYTGKRWGTHFLRQVFNEIFESPEKPRVVYLNTRDSNHEGVVKFYSSVNMNVIHTLTYPDDLLPATPQQRRTGDHPARVPA